MKMCKLILSALLVLISSFAVDAQSVWSRERLDEVKNRLNEPMYSTTYKQLIRDADSLLYVTPWSVMMKEKMSPSGDNHNYTSLARYFHPDPSSPDGLPYINRDGITNPEIKLWDRTRLGETAERIATLSLAWYLSGDERYADKAVQLIDTWFLDKKTKMNPNLEYAQMVPGVNNGKGRSYGVLDAYSFVEMLDGVALLDGSKAWTKKKNRELKKWMEALLNWMLNSEQGIEEAKQANNHSTAYDAQIIALAMYVGRDDIARRVVNEFPHKRIFTQIMPDGIQPHEMWRTLSYGYSQYNLTHMIDVFLMAQKLGEPIDNATDSEGRNFYKALDYLASYLGQTVDKWPGNQISDWDEKQQAVTRDLLRASLLGGKQSERYRSLYRTYRVFDPSERFILLYYSPDEIDNAMTNAAQSLRYAIDRVYAERKRSDNALGHKVSPRSIDANGTITLVHPHDWTSGFFPGELWIMYQFTNDPYWRQQAVSFTWDIEESKTHRGTHDLGFMMGDSFGKAWEITGEKNFFDVLLQSCETLSTRFKPTAGVIRSWDHNAQLWHYPVIIDNMMNLEMLFKMSQETGNPKYKDIAVSHADKTLANHFRPDYSSYHVVDYDPETGNVRMKVTAQGYADDSFWSRGQGWGLYGYTMCYRYTHNPQYLDQAEGIADWFLNLPNMPDDLIPYWDMKAPGTETAHNDSIPRDASAAAIIASGLYELAGYVAPDKGASYHATADKIVDNLIAGYTIQPGTGEGFLLRHSTGHHPTGSEIDVPLVYADYYFLEALMRRLNNKMIKTN